MNGPSPYAIKRPVRKQYCVNTEYGNSSRILWGKPVPVYISESSMAVPNTRMSSRFPTEKNEKKKKTNLVNIVAKAMPPVNDSKVTHTKHNFTVCIFNPRSAKNKTPSLSDFILSHDLDIIALTETWLGCAAVDNVCIGELVSPGYRMESVPR